ncbi:MAG: gamma-glutamylcyclotransferase [Gammaproteobacteria bacterium]|jgi:gamma-glutamylcyclotransferase
MTINYFAYGSNLASNRLLQRIPGARVRSFAFLEKHQLSFRMNSNDESGKCDIVITGHSDQVVPGVVYKITPDEKLILDEYESLGVAYFDKTIQVKMPDNSVIEAITYYGIITNAKNPPYHWYKEHVLRGAIEHGLPNDHINWIKDSPSVDDPDQVRSERELLIYR